MKSLCAALAAFLFGVAGAAAQLSPLSDLYQRFDRGITIGTNVSVELPGTLRWSDAVTNLQVYAGTNWTSIAGGSGGGSGSGFPLPEDADAGGFAVTNFSALGFSGSTNLLLQDADVLYYGGVRVGSGEGSLKELVAHDTTNKFAVTNLNLASLSLFAGDNVVMEHAVAGSNSVVTLSAVGGLEGPMGPAGLGGLAYGGMFATNAIYTNDATLVNHAGDLWYTTNQYAAGNPPPTPTNALGGPWTFFLPGGRDGEDGEDGLPGAQLVFRPWTNGITLSTNDLVAYDGRLFVPLSYLDPAPVPSVVNEFNTNYFLAVDRGASGASGTVYEGLFYAGGWQANVAYPSNALVTYNLNAYLSAVPVAETNPPPPNAPWRQFAQDGPVGLQGPQGVHGIGNLQFMGTWQSLATGTYPANAVVSYGTPPNWYRARSLVAGTTFPTATGSWEKVLWSGQDATVFGAAFYASYNNAQSYPANAWVRHNGVVWRSVAPVPAGSPTEFVPPNASYWQLVVRDGTSAASNLVFRGAWAAGAYDEGDLVAHANGNSYFATDSTSAEPPGTNWTLFVTKGDQGPVGPAGPDGTATYVTNFVTYSTQNVFNVTNIYAGTNYYSTNIVTVSNTVIQTVVTNAISLEGGAVTLPFDFELNSEHFSYSSGDNILSVVGGGGGGTGTVDGTEVRAIRDEPQGGLFFDLVPVLADGTNTFSITGAGTKYQRITDRDDGRTSIDVDLASFNLEGRVSRVWLCYVRGTNDIQPTVATNLIGYQFLSFPVSSTNNIFISRNPGSAGFTALQLHQ